MRDIPALALSCLISALFAGGQTHGTHDQLDARGAREMGFDQEKTAHHFYLYADGGAIEVSAKDPSDTASLRGIRSHLPHIAMMFGDGDFSAPMLVHARDVPGTADMARLRDHIRFRYEEIPRGGRVSVTTVDTEAAAAVHAFLRFQIADHKTGDSLDVRRR